ncbi:MAG: hypothetical protein ACWA5A_15355 [Marinibacterium sp.]
MKLVLGLVAACAMPSDHFRGQPVTRVDVEDSRFDVRVRGDLAESIRTGPAYAPRFGPIRYRAARAMALASGCEVTDVLGDQAVQVGLLDCGTGKPRKWGLAIPPRYDCLEMPTGLTDGDGWELVDFECTPYWR